MLAVGAFLLAAVLIVAGAERQRLQRPVRGRRLQQVRQGAGAVRLGARRYRVARLRGARRVAPLRVSRAHAVRHRRHDGDGLGHQPDVALSRPGAASAVALRAGRLRPRRTALRRGGAEVFRAGRAGLGPAALRHFAGLRLRRQHGLRQAGAGAGRSCPCLARADRRRRVHHRRPRLQDFRGAVPHVDPGCLRGRADAGHRLPGHRAQGGRHRAAGAGDGGAVRPLAGAMAAGHRRGRPCCPWCWGRWPPSGSTTSSG